MGNFSWMIEPLFWLALVVLFFCGLFILFDKNLSANEERGFLFLSGISFCLAFLTGVAKFAGVV